MHLIILINSSCNYKPFINPSQMEPYCKVLMGRVWVKCWSVWWRGEDYEQGSSTRFSPGLICFLDLMVMGRKKLLWIISRLQIDLQAQTDIIFDPKIIILNLAYIYIGSHAVSLCVGIICNRFPTFKSLGADLLVFLIFYVEQ